MKNISMINNLNDKRVVFVENKKNMGSAGSRNVGIKKSTGNYITFLEKAELFFHFS